MFLLAVTLAAGFYAFEERLPYSGYISFAATISMITAWIWISFTAGFAKRGGFVLFSLSYWLIPQFFITSHLENIADMNYSANFHMASRFAEILVRTPFNSICEIINVSTFIAGMGLLLLCEAAFFSGFIFRGKCKDRQWYRNLFE
jgi:hypothetical protein